MRRRLQDRSAAVDDCQPGRVRSGNVVEAAEELHVEIQALKRDFSYLLAAADLVEARTMVVRQRAEAIAREQRGATRAA